MKLIFLNYIKKILFSIKSVYEMCYLAWQAQPMCFLGIFLINYFQGITPVGAAWITKEIFDLLVSFIQQQNSIKTIPWDNIFILLSGYTLINILSQLFLAASDYLSSELNRQLHLKVRLIIYEKINSLNGIAPFEDPIFYTKIQSAIQGADRGPQAVITTLTSFISSLIILLSFIGILLAFDSFLALMVILAAIPRIFIYLKFGQQRINLFMVNSPAERLAGYYEFVMSNSEFAKEVRLFGLGNHFLQAFRQLWNKVNNTMHKQELHEFIWNVVLNSGSLIIASVAFALIIVRAFTGLITPGSVALYITAVSSVQGSLLGLISAVSSLNESSLFYSKFKDLLALPQPVQISSSVEPMHRLTSQIEFRNVSFRYSDQYPWVLHNFNLKIPAGQSLALVGLNGAGKTTLAKLLSRLYDPVEGQILWDNVDIREFDILELRGRITAIFQDFIRYELSAYDNIALGNVIEFSDSNQVRQAAVQADINDVILSLPQGYQTILSHWLADKDDGIDLSGGEWQKIALARMFMRRAELLILDEPTASLDAEAEYNLYSRFLKLIEGKTSILISHRFSTIRMANKIAVLCDGKITEYGSHDELMELRGTYSRLYAQQSEMYL